MRFSCLSVESFRFIDNELERLEGEGRLREPVVIDGPCGPVVAVGKKRLTSFCSNNYLGLANHPLVREAAKRAIDEFGMGMGASRLISGTSTLHKHLEEEIARFEGRAAALVFTTGYQANMGLVSALVGSGDAVLSDRLNHASIHDACRLSRAKCLVYPHKDMDALEGLLKRASHFERRLIMTDGVFSMDGDLAPLQVISELAQKHDALWAVDEAHGTGVLGEQGRGAHEVFGLGRQGIVVGTLSKALGSLGGFVSGDKSLVRFLENRSRTYFYTTALAPACVAGALAALGIVRREPERRARLAALSLKVRKALLGQGWEVAGLESAPIIPVMTGTVELTMKLARYFFEQNLLIPGIRPPTVPEGEGRVRVTLMSEHTDAEIDQLIEVFGNAREFVRSEEETIAN